MTPAELAAASASDLVNAYAQAARAHAAATESGRHRVANRAHDDLGHLFAELRRRGPVGLATLAVRLDDAEPAVRCWAATHALSFAPERGAAVLEALAGGAPSPLRLAAEMTLQEWRAGRLRF
ncbi:MAG: DUF2019 domain-containing protein [Gemmatimonadetes bacterium]|nr:DUF2019 domain-containing protein [Gemmatimonadota bacterium]